MPGFDALAPTPAIRAALEAMGYHQPTPVQEQGIPAIFAGGDVLLEARTGSGKTAAFGVPAIHVGSGGPGLRVLVLVPTRELARQVADELRDIGTGSNFRAVAVTGGVHAEKEERAIGGDVRCIVATPGRLLALLEERKVHTDRIEMVILDEADRMLDMGFRADIERILHATSGRKQAILVSATLPREVTSLARAHLRSPREIRATRLHLPEKLVHQRLNVFDDQKERALLALLQRENPQRAIVFVRTRTRAAAYAKLLKNAGYAADQLQGKMAHEQRRHVFDLFSHGVTKILVATDIASRGLDVPEMELVINVDLPDEPDAYTHRAGRAARLDREGRVVSFVLPDEKPLRLKLEQESGGEWAPYKLDPIAIKNTEIPTQRPKPKAKAKPAPPPASPAAAAPARAPPARAPTSRAPAARAPPNRAPPPRRDTREAREPTPRGARGGQGGAPTGAAEPPPSRRARSRR